MDPFIYILNIIKKVKSSFAPVGNTSIAIVRFPHTLGGRTSKVVASHAEDARSSPVKAEPIYMYCAQVALRGECSLKGGG